MDPHHFGNPDPYLHQGDKPDPDPHQLKISIRIHIKRKVEPKEIGIFSICQNLSLGVSTSTPDNNYRNAHP
jgi:hypothetical protein